MLSPLNQIIVQCPREDTTHMQITAFGTGLSVEHGHILNGLSIRFLRVGDKERLNFSEHPELLEIYDGIAWNAFELFAFVAKQEAIDIEAQESSANVESTQA